MPKKIIIFRHGETDHNLKEIAQGWLNTSLNITGKKQAEKLANSQSGIKIDALYSSDLKRAMQTARKVGKILNTKIKTTKLLRERNQGIFSNKSFAEIEKNYSQMYQKYKDQNNQHWKEHGGESRQDVRNRIQKMMNLLHRKHTDQTVMISTHGGPKRELLRLLGLVSEQIHLNNTSVSIVEKTNDGSYILTTLNNTDHLNHS